MNLSVHFYKYRSSLHLPALAFVASQAFVCLSNDMNGLLAQETAAVKTQADSTGTASAEATVSSESAIVYNRDVRPILADHCFACHGPDSASRQADLRLDRRDDAMASTAFVAGDPGKSELIRRIELPEDDELAMPPASGHKRLTNEQKQTLVQWIAQGAQYQPHWSFIAPTRPELPAVSNLEWVRNPIDQFILAELDKSNLKPAVEADRRTLARRASLDLTGLPPTVEQVESFVADPSPDAYERFVDSLLESKRYGEHRGRYWLDYARFGDTHGIHFDNYREMWSYRDWVIDAFNRNLPFDQFTIEQLAGDLLPQPSLDQMVATGFNRCNITTNEGGVIAEEYKVLYARDRTETTSLVWMALTTGCAVCHDHKFDPISQTEFYQLSAFFNNTTQPVMDGNVPNTPPVISVPLFEDRERFIEVQTAVKNAQQQLNEIRTNERQRFDAGSDLISSDEIADTATSDGLILHGLLGEGAGPASTLMINGKPRIRVAQTPLKWGEGHSAPAALEIAPDSVLNIGQAASDLEFDRAFSYGAWIHPKAGNVGGAVFAKMNENNDYRGFDLWLEGNRVGAHIIHKWPDNAVKVVTKNPLAANQWHHVFITYNGSGNDDGLQIYINGVLQGDRTVTAKSLTATIRNDVPMLVGARSNGSSPSNVLVNDIRLYERLLTPGEVAQIATASRIAYLAARPAAARLPQQNDELFAWWLNLNSTAYSEAVALLATLNQEESAIRSRGTIAHVMTEQTEEAEAFVLARGEYDQRGQRVTPSVPAVFPSMPDDLPKNRMGLAKWLLRDDHPLTARVTVNRFWQEVFGVGLVASSGDFGITGELPSHPELLDWLAVDFRESGWDVKRLLRMIVTSSAYRQSAQTDEQKLAIDRDNRLLSRGPRFRMDAEMIRDYTLQASGLLSAKIGGPSVKPYQPEGVWEAVAMRGSNTRDYRRDQGESLYRRSLYTFWKRSAPPASMDIFNAPSREVCTIRRDRTNTPLQALATLNDPQAIEAARNLAAIAIKSSSEPDVRVDLIAKRVLARSFDAPELEIIKDSIASLSQYFQDNPDAAIELIKVGDSPVPADIATSELATYTMLANQVMNLDEVLNK
jgi:mono/diheme cytochrome c family protein